ncbi:hypothetical protein SOVF_187470, partial [Spinacia oleracea]
LSRGPVLSSRHEHVLASIHASNPQPHGEVEAPPPVTHEDLRRLAEQFNDTLEQSLRAVVLNLQDGNEGLSRPRWYLRPPTDPLAQRETRSRPQSPISTLSRRGPPRTVREQEPTMGPPRHIRRYQTLRSPPPSQWRSRGNARRVIVRRRLGRGKLDAREIINSRREDDRREDTDRVSDRSQHESSRRSFSQSKCSLTPLGPPRSRHGSSRERDQEEK